MSDTTTDFTKWKWVFAVFVKSVTGSTITASNILCDQNSAKRAEALVYAGLTKQVPAFGEKISKKATMLAKLLETGLITLEADNDSLELSGEVPPELQLMCLSAMSLTKGILTLNGHDIVAVLGEDLGDAPSPVEEWPDTIM